MLPTPEIWEADLYRQLFTYLERPEIRLKTLGAEARPVVEPLAEPEDSENGDATYFGTALRRSLEETMMITRMITIKIRW